MQHAASVNPSLGPSSVCIVDANVRIAGQPNWRATRKHRQSPILFPVKSTPEVRVLSSTGITRPRRSYNPVRLLPAPSSFDVVEAATPVPNGPPPITRITFPTCRSYYPGGSRQVLRSVTPLSHTIFPVTAAGRHPHLRIRDLPRLHSRYGPLDCSTAQRRLCHAASAQPVTQPNRPSAIRPYRHRSGRILPPLVIRAVGARTIAVVVPWKNLPS